METSKEIVVLLTPSDTWSYYLQFIDSLNASKESTIFYQKYFIPVSTVNNEETIEECVKYVKKMGKKCVVSFSDDTVDAAAIINKRLGYPYPSLLSQMYCNHKLLTRMLVNDFDWFHGFNLDESIPSVLAKAKGRPCMLKPTMLACGRGAYRCDDMESLSKALQAIFSDDEYCRKIEQQHSVAVETIRKESQEVARQCTQYMIEELLEVHNTYQFCMEAFITNEGKIIPYALIEELRFNHGMFLGHMIPPIHLDDSLQACEDYLIQIGEKLREIGFRNHVFNIEFWKLSDGRLQLTEINPRTVTPFFPLYKQYSGCLSYNDIADLLISGKEPLQTPFSKLKREWPIHKEDGNAKYTLLLDLDTRATGKVSDVFNYDEMIEEMAKRNIPLFMFTPKDSVLTELNKSYIGTSIIQVVIQGSWSNIVTQAKDLRKRFYKDLSQCEEDKEYPDYFDVL